MEYDEVAAARSVRGEVLLRRRRADGALELRVNGVFVMDTVETGSEEELARRALALSHAPERVLVGGLGLGFTTRAVLEDERVARVDVAEIEDDLVAWLAAGLVPGGAELLADPRVHVRVGDVRSVIEAAPSATYDLVLLDVDNGPGYLVHAGNAAVYRTPFLGEVRRVLRAGGAAVVWAANDAPLLEKAMAEVFGSCHRVPHPVVLQDRTEEYLLYVSRARPEAG